MVAKRPWEAIVKRWLFAAVVGLLLPQPDMARADQVPSNPRLPVGGWWLHCHTIGDKRFCDFMFGEIPKRRFFSISCCSHDTPNLIGGPRGPFPWRLQNDRGDKLDFPTIKSRSDPAALGEALDLIVNADYLHFGWWHDWKKGDFRLSDPDVWYSYPNPDSEKAIKLYAKECLQYTGRPLHPRFPGN